MESQNFAPQRHQITANSPIQSALEAVLEVLFDDRQVVVAGMSSPWAGRRRRIDLAELVDEPWMLPEGPDSWNYRVVAEAFRTRGLRVPKISVMTLSIHL